MKIGAVLVNTGCDNNCLFCPGLPAVSEYELQKIEMKIASNTELFLRDKISTIEVSGADLCSYKDLWKLLGYLNDRFQEVRLSTHGKCIYKHISELIKSGVKEVKIPLYGPSPEIHRKIARGDVNGEVFKSLRALKDSGIKITITSLITKYNYEHLSELYDFARQFTPRINIGMPFILKPEEFYIPYRQVGSVVRKLIEAKREPNILDIPRVIGKEYEHFYSSKPPELGNEQPPDMLKTHIKNTPSYRLKMRMPICANCIYKGKCDGFLQNDIKFYGAGDWRPFNG